METITTGKRLKALREDRGLSQSQLAKKADINSRVLQTSEQDDRDIAGAKLKRSSRSASLWSAGSRTSSQTTRRWH